MEDFSLQNIDFHGYEVDRIENLAEHFSTLSCQHLVDETAIAGSFSCYLTLHFHVMSL